MTRLAPAAALLMLAFSAGPLSAGLFSKCHQSDCCEPSCAVPSCAAPCDTACAPSCSMPYGPTCAVPTCTTCAPSCAAPWSSPSCGCPTVYGGGDCGFNGCDGGCGDCCPQECCLKRLGRRLWSLEKRKNACLMRTFFGKGCQSDCGNGCDGGCAPVEYYQPGCAAPSCGLPASACGCR